MVLGSHLIFTTYGFWLPNDPRGSWSDFVGSWELFRVGAATTTNERRSVAWEAHDVARRLAAKQALKYPAMSFDGLQARAVARGFAKSLRMGGVTVWACAILPEHVHMVIARHKESVESLARWLRFHATRRLLAEQRHPVAAFQEPLGELPSCWAVGEWKVFLDTVEAIDRAIAYVEENPVKEGKRRQQWGFVKPFDPRVVARWGRTIHHFV